jgi:hypothetical protein
MCQPEGHNSVFKYTIAGLECSFELVAFFDLDEMVGIPDVQFSENQGFVQSIE